MTSKILDGLACSKKIKEKVAEDVQEMNNKGLPPPGLTVILVGDDAASAAYVHKKQAGCKEVGIRSHVHRLPIDTSQQTLEDLIDQCNQDPSVNGILLQLPVPEHIDSGALLERIHPHKDVDGFHPYNLGRLVQRRPALRPCTPRGIMMLLEQTGEDLAGKHAVIVGASNIVGRPMALELLLAKCTITVCHRFTQHLKRHVEDADLLVVAIGSPGVVKSEWIKPGAIVVDVGFSRLTDGEIFGDIEFESAKKRASWITPVPGGVGPMTVATLLENTLQAAKICRMGKVL